MTKKEFLEGMIILSDVYGKDMGERAIGTWYMFFKDDDFAVFKQGVSRVIMKAKYFPSVAEIKEEMHFVTAPALTAEEEWNKVEMAIRRYGYYNSSNAMETLDPTTQRAVKNIGGFSRLCTSDSPYWDRKNFIEAFNQLKKRESNNLLLRPIKAENLLEDSYD